MVSLRKEVYEMIENDKRLKNIRFDEIYNLIENNKSMQQELMSLQFDNQKALLKAITNKEQAERQTADDEMASYINRQLAKLTNSQTAFQDEIQIKYKDLDGKIEKAHDSLQMKFNNNQIKIDSQVEELHNLINTNNECINDINT